MSLVTRALARLSGSTDPRSMAMAMAGESYEASGGTTPEMRHWYPGLKSADADYLAEASVLKGRTRDIIRNNSHAAGAVNITKDNVVGAQYKLLARPNALALAKTGKGFDESWEDAFTEEVESEFQPYADSDSCWIDAEGKNVFTEHTRLAVAQELVEGEAMFVASYDSAPFRPYMLTLQCIDPDRVETPPHLTSDDNVRAGVRLNARGRAVGYYVRRRHRSDDRMLSFSPDDFDYVPAYDRAGGRRFIHIYDPGRPALTRGISTMVSALKELRLGDRYREHALSAKALQSMYAASLETDIPYESLVHVLGGGAGNAGGGGGVDDLIGAANSYSENWFSKFVPFFKASSGARIGGARVPHLPPGVKMKVNAIGGADSESFNDAVMQNLAATTGLSFGQVSRKFSNISFSAMKGEVNAQLVHLQSKKAIVADRFANSVYRLWLRESIMSGKIESLPAHVKANPLGFLYDNPGVLDALARAEWIGASRGQIDEKKETEAAHLRVQHGLSTIQDEAARLGRDWRAVRRQRRREIAAEAQDARLAPKPETTS